MANSISRQLIIDEARRRGWHVSTFGLGGVYYTITNSKGEVQIMRGARPIQSSANGAVIAKYKHITLAFCESIGYGMPAYIVPDTDAEAVDFMRASGPIVVKPIDAEQSKGVTVGIADEKKLLKALDYARSYSESKQIILQQHLEGKLYRLMVINGKFVGAIHRKAAEIVGDGSQTIEQLIEQANRDPRRGSDKSSIMKQIDLTVATEFLGADRMLQVPMVNEVVKVCSIDSVSAGGEAINVSDETHETWRNFAVDVATRANLFVCGLDILCPDVAQAMPTPVPLLEINSMPGLKLLHYPTAGGSPINAASLLLDEIFA